MKRKKKMYIIIGLGNPSEKYKGTRHNVGFEAIDWIAKKNQISVDVGKHKSLCGSGLIGGKKVILIKPLTYMNLSGEAVRSVVDFYKVDPTNQCIVIYDDVSLEVGQIRIRKKGSAGGHNGMKSIISHLGTQEFIRVRMGIGKKPSEMDLADYVLGRFDDVDRAIIRESIETIEQAVSAIVENDVDVAMSVFNKSKKETEEEV